MIYIFYRISVKYPEKTLISQNGDHRRTNSDARAVAKLVAERCKAKGIDTVVFDRGGYLYHGRVAELAEGAREGGLEF